MQNNLFNSFLKLPMGVRRIFIVGSIFPIYEAYLERELTLKEKKEFLDAIIKKRILFNINKHNK